MGFFIRPQVCLQNDRFLDVRAELENHLIRLEKRRPTASRRLFASLTRLTLIRFVTDSLDLRKRR